jgi:hypothetical protein
MNRMAPVPFSPSEDLDVLLVTFFKGEMPASWPAFQPPAAVRTLSLQDHRSALPPRPLIGSRLALAASVGVLLLGGWMLNGRLTTPPGTTLPTLRNPGTADPRHRFPAGFPQGLEDPQPEGGKGEQPKSPDDVSISLEQGKDGLTGIKIIVPPRPSNR